MTVGATSSASDVNVASSPASSAAADATITSDRFLKLLVAQMKNQDPLNPMDNAQVTSQMAQINTVTGIDKLNSTVQGLSTQFVQLQAMQGASLVGRDVIVAGNKLSVHYQGACGTCPSSISGTLRGIQNMLRSIEPEIEVEAM